MFGSIFDGRKVLVTGHTGFKGSWTALWLDLLGASVTGYALEPPTKPSHFETCKLETKIEHIEGDVRDLEHLTKVFNQHKPDIVFHMAAQSLVTLITTRTLGQFLAASKTFTVPMTFIS